MRWFLSLWCLLLFCAQRWWCVESQVATTVVDITEASKTNQIPLICTTTTFNRTYTWKFTPSSTGMENVLDANGNNYSISSGSDTGLYLCDVGGSIMKTFSARNFSNPLIPHTGRSIVLVEGDVDKTLDCYSYSYPTPEIVWSVTFPDDSDPVMLSGSVSKTYSIRNSTLGSSTLTISSVEFNVRGTYHCTATSNTLNVTVTTSVLIRVHTRLAPLWPFLGIVCEVLIVACIILVVRKKSKSTEEELKEPLKESYSYSSQDEGSSNARYRGGTRN